MRLAHALFAAALLLLPAPATQACDQAGPAHDPAGLPAGHARALEVARSAFARHLGPAPDGANALVRRMHEIDAYRAETRHEGAIIVVTFFPVPPPGVSLRGGGAEYRVEAATGKIVDFHGFQ